MHSQNFAKEETKSRKDKRSREVALSLISEKYEKESQRWNTRFSEMETNFDEERAKPKNNLDEVKALVDHHTHKVHEQNILRREEVAKEVEKRKKVLQTVAYLNQWVNEIALELKVRFIFILLHDLCHLQSSLTNVQSSLMNYS